MKQTTITLSDEVEQALSEYLQEQETGRSLNAIVEMALRQYLGEHGYLSPAQPLKITPAKHGSGKHDISVNHDSYLADQ